MLFPLIKRNKTAENYLEREQPHIKLGIFKLRLPFIHYRLTLVEFIQGLVLVAIPLGGAAQMMNALDLPWVLAVPMCAWFAILVCLHPTLGDPTFPGYITPGIPLITAYVLGFPSGPERIQALMAVQLILAFLFFIMSITGWAKTVMAKVPQALKGGILLGAGISSFAGIMGEGGRLQGREVSALVGVAVVFLILFSQHYAKLKPKYKVFQFLGNYGLLVGLFIALFLGIAIGELKIPTPEFGFTNLGLIVDVAKSYSIFALGVPSLSLFIKGIPMAIALYIIAFGDFVLAETITGDTDSARPDEYIEFNPIRSNMICAIRNLILGLLCPYITLAGPIWSGGVVVTAERYKQGPQAMDSFYDGIASYTIGMGIATCLTIFTSMLQPVMQHAMILCLTVQGYSCGYISIQSLKSKEQLSIAVIMATVMTILGTAQGMIVGVILVILIGDSYKEPKEDIAAKANAAAGKQASAIDK